MKDKVTIYVWPNGSWAFESKIKNNLDLYLLETGKFKNFTIHHIPKELNRDEINNLAQKLAFDNVKFFRPTKTKKDKTMSKNVQKTDEVAKIYIWPDGSWEYESEFRDLDLYLMETGKSDDYVIHYVSLEMSYDEVDELVALINRF